MTYKLDDKQFKAICKKSDDERYDYFMRKVADWEEIWSLSSAEGWVELSDEEGQVCLPIWPHPDFAAKWATGDWSDCKPKAIKLEVWLERWTPGLESDDTALLIFPVGEEEGIVQTPAEVHQALLDQFAS
jgi:hypothetical protein